jgi:hypothetical protein
MIAPDFYTTLVLSFPGVTTDPTVQGNYDIPKAGVGIMSLVYCSLIVQSATFVGTANYTIMPWSAVLNFNNYTNFVQSTYSVVVPAGSSGSGNQASVYISSLVPFYGNAVVNASVTTRMMGILVRPTANVVLAGELYTVLLNFGWKLSPLK